MARPDCLLVAGAALLLAGAVAPPGPLPAVAPIERVRVDRFAALDYRPVPGDVATNRLRLLALARAAADGGARYIVLPELGLTGALGAALAEQAELIPGPSTAAFAALARERGVWIAVSLAERLPEVGAAAYSISTVLFDDHGEVASQVRKRVLRPGGSDGPATVGFARVLLDTVDDRGRRIGVVSGDDLQDGVPRLADRGAETLLVAANWSAEDPVHWGERAAKLAAEYRVNLVVANARPGFSTMIDRTGRSVAAERSPGLVLGALATPERGFRVLASLGLPPSVPVPSQQPFSPDLVELGRELFFDTKLSVSGEVACASCHKPELAFADGRALAEGVYGRHTRRNAPSLLNVAFRTPLQWDGNPTTIEQQFKYPLSGFAELNLRSYEDLYGYLRSRPEYMARFHSELGVAPGELTREHVAMALSTFLRTLISASSPFDRYFYGGERTALEPAAIRGLALFRGRARCTDCHRMGRDSALFMDSRFHRLGIGYVPEKGLYTDPGVGVVSNSDYSGMFFTPPLRNVAETGPYMHDGSVTTLEGAIRAHYAFPELDPTLVPVALTDAEVMDLVAFLRSLSGSERYDERGRKLEAGLAALGEETGGSSRARSRRLIGRGR